VLGAQHISRSCFVCGVENKSGLHARFFELEGKEIAGVFTPGQEHQGYPGRLHGGVAATLLDETIGRAVSIADPSVFGVTLELNVKYRKPVPLDAEVRAIGRVSSDPGRVFEGTGEIVLDDGSVAVEARGRYLRRSIERIATADFSEDDWRADEAPRPESIDI
jgi:uncharacterized protein (TIGR00369 family)